MISGLVTAFASNRVDVIDMASVIVGQMHEQGVNMRVFRLGVGTLECWSPCTPRVDR